jgi:2-keto-4-pentenoate hydratase/2-oxohepta-3-ene-1,7-dioic acid hydratase in catechol pathway
VQLTKLCRLTTMRSDARSKIHVWGMRNVSVRKLQRNRTKTERSGKRMTNAAWWARVVQARTQHGDLLPQRVWTLRNGEHGRERRAAVPRGEH